MTSPLLPASATLVARTFVGASCCGDGLSLAAGDTGSFDLWVTAPDLATPYDLTGCIVSCAAQYVLAPRPPRDEERCPPPANTDPQAPAFTLSSTSGGGVAIDADPTTGHAVVTVPPMATTQLPSCGLRLVFRVTDASGNVQTVLRRLLRVVADDPPAACC